MPVHQYEIRQINGISIYQLLAHQHSQQLVSDTENNMQIFVRGYNQNAVYLQNKLIQLIMSSSLQEIKQATARRTSGLFFIKSKHVNPTFNNHSYFEMKPNLKNRTQNAQKSQKSEKSDNKTQNLKRWKMFVQQPKSYGIENTFRYICDRIRHSKKKLTAFKTIQQQKHKHSPKEKTPQRQKTLTMASQNYHNPTLVQNSQDKNMHMHIKIKQRLRTEPASRYLNTTESFNYRIRKSKPMNQTQKQYSPKISRVDEPNAEHLVEIIYINGRNSYVDINLENRLIVNLLPYILNCFLKCRINYLKKLSQSQYNRIIANIEEIKLSAKSYFDVKDIVNLASIEEVMKMLDIYGHCTLQWIETIRYFFMPTEDILNYQFQKLEDEIKIMSILKFNVQLNQQPIFIYRVEDKVKINNIYDMLKPGTYIYSQNKAIYQIYCGIMKRKSQLYSYKNRIKKWRSVAPLDETITFKNPQIQERVDRLHSQKGQSLQKYKKIYEMAKQRRKRHHNERSRISVNDVLITHQNSSFIDRTKLHHSEDIFQ